MMKGAATRPCGTRAYDHPRSIVESDTLSHERKVAARESWKLDLLGLQGAADENMPSTNRRSGGAGDELRQVLEALAEVRERRLSPRLRRLSASVFFDAAERGRSPRRVRHRSRSMREFGRCAGSCRSVPRPVAEFPPNQQRIDRTLHGPASEIDRFDRREIHVVHTHANQHSVSEHCTDTEL